jgi:outer membrane protein assembly factor BamB
LVAGLLVTAPADGAVPAGGTPAATSGVNWPGFRYNAAHLGVTPEKLLSSGNVASLKAGWSAALGANSDTSPAVAAPSGVVRVYAADLSGVASAYDAGSGAASWTFTAGGTAPVIFTSPTVFGGDVYLASATGTLYALNASTGAVVCSFNTGKRIQSSPTVVADPDGSGPVVFVGTEQGGGEWAVYGAGSTHGACSKDWFFNGFTVKPSGTWSSAAYGTDADGTHVVVFGSKDNDDSVYALNAGTGALLWRYQTSNLVDQDVGSSPLVAAPGVNGLTDGATYVEGKDGYVYALDLTKGSLLWKSPVASPGLNVSSPSLVGASLLVGSNAGLYSFNAVSGHLDWRALATTSISSSPAVSGGSGTRVAFVGGLKGNLYAVNVGSGAVLWTGTTTSGFYGSPAVSHGVLYDVDLGGTLHSYTT